MLGGPSDLWMWMTAVIGMATKYAEAVLALKYRTRSADGTIAGGPMYYIEKGMKNRWLALAFAVFGVVATIGGAGMAQANSIAHGITLQLSLEWTVSVPFLGELEVVNILIGLALVASTGLVIIGGIKRIGRVASWVIPIMSVLYVGAGLLVMLINYDRVPGAVALIFQHAFSPYAVAGGAIGYAISEAIRYGVARGVFTNEAGWAARRSPTLPPGRNHRWTRDCWPCWKCSSTRSSPARLPPSLYFRAGSGTTASPALP